MSKVNNLTDFLTDVADAIREKKGLTNLINPQDFHDEILSIKSGGGPVIEGEGAHKVTFIDYDGTVLKEQYVNEGESATPPDVPEHEHLTFNEWIGAYTNVTKNKIIGAHYKSSDDKTWMHHTNGEYVRLYYTGTAATIDWGDGHIESSMGGLIEHRYTDNASHWISIDGGNLLFDGHSYNIVNIDSIILGSNVAAVSTNGFWKCYSLKSIVVPKEVTIGSYMFQYCYCLSAIVIPNGITTLRTSCFSQCFSLKYAVIPDTVTNITSGAFEYCYSLTSINLPETINITNADSSTYWFRGCYSLASIVIPESMKHIFKYTFHTCYSLSSIVIPNGITSIREYAFYSCKMLKYIILKPTVPPTLYDTSTALPNTLKAIYVPDSSVSAYQAATNWSDFASKIKGISEMPAE